MMIMQMLIIIIVGSIYWLFTQTSSRNNLTSFSKQTYQGVTITIPALYLNGNKELVELGIGPWVSESKTHAMLCW